MDYTFNGLGYYWMVKTTSKPSEGDFNMQAQTGIVTNNNGTNGNATVFTRFAAQDNKSDIIEIQLEEPDGNSLYL